MAEKVYPHSSAPDMPEGKKTPLSRYVVVGISAVLVTLIIVGGMVCALYFMSSNTESVLKTIHLAGQEDELGKETLEEFPGHVMQFSVPTTDGDLAVVIDYGRHLTVVRHPALSVCYMIPETRGTYEQISLVDFGDDAFKSSNKSDDRDVKDVFKLIPTDITDRDILGKRAQAMCEGLALARAIPLENAPQRQKRSHVCKYVNYACGYTCTVKYCCHRVCDPHPITPPDCFGGRGGRPGEMCP